MSYIDTINKEDEVGTCEHCGQPVMVGEKGVSIDGYIFCEDCLKNMTGEEAMSFFGFEIRELTEDDKECY